MAVSIRRRAAPEFVSAICQASDAVQSVVRVSGPSVGGLYQVTAIDITALPVEMAFGIIVSKASSTLCTVQVGGELIGVYTGLTPGRPLFVDDAAKLSHSIPTRPITGVKLSYLAATALDTDKALLNFQPLVIMQAG